jgi:hypothetical protein
VFEFYMPDGPPVDACWDWNGRPGSKGYGVFKIGRKEYRAHVVAYRLFVGEVGSGLEILHSCDRPICVNPHHLSAGTHAENMAQSAARKRARGMIGEEHHQAKIVEPIVLEIRRRAKEGEVQAALAREFGLSDSQTSRIVRSQSWSHVG